MLDPTTVILFIMVLFVTVWYLSRRSYKNLPPGPPAWPIVGNAWGMRQNLEFHLDLYKYSRKYGKIYSLRFGSRPVIVLCSHDLIREAFVTKADYFSDRPNDLYWMKFLTQNGGKVSSTYEQYINTLILNEYQNIFKDCVY